ncbi:MAG: hypothetical protein M5T61_12260 [Acidimicrobiia bacterium]|nr:hypothetical protein [Acidimicrobiia bacterium]
MSALEHLLTALPEKDRTVVKLSFVGTLSLRESTRLEEMLDHHRDLFAALETWERHTDLAVLPDDGDYGALELTGFARDTFAELAERARSTGEDATAASDALALLYRLAGGAL